MTRQKNHATIRLRRISEMPTSAKNREPTLMYIYTETVTLVIDRIASHRRMSRCQGKLGKWRKGKKSPEAPGSKALPQWTLDTWMLFWSECICMLGVDWEIGMVIITNDLSFFLSGFRRPNLRAVLIRISKRKRKRVCTSHTEFATNLWHLWRSQTVTSLNLWQNLFLQFLLVFLVIWVWSHFGHTCHEWSHFQMWCLRFMFTFSRKWFRMKWNPEKHNRTWPLFVFYVWNLDENGSNAGSRINFRTTFPDSLFSKWVQERQISKSRTSHGETTFSLV